MVVPSDPTYAPSASGFTRASTQVTLLPEDRPGHVRRALEIEMQDRRRQPVPRFDQAAQQEQQAESMQEEEQPRPTALLGDLLSSIPRSAAAEKQLRALRSWGAAHAAAFSLPADQASIDSIPLADLFGPGEEGGYPSLQALVAFGRLRSPDQPLAPRSQGDRLGYAKTVLGLPAVQAVFSGSGQPGNDDGLTERDRQGLIAAVDDAIKAAQRDMAAAQAAGNAAAAAAQPGSEQMGNNRLPAQQQEQGQEQEQEQEHSAGSRKLDAGAAGAAVAQPRQPAPSLQAAHQQRPGEEEGEQQEEEQEDHADQEEQQDEMTQTEQEQEQEQPQAYSTLGELLQSGAFAKMALPAWTAYGAAHAAAFSLPANQASIDSIPLADLFSPGEAADYPSLQALVAFGKLKVNGRSYASGGRLAASTLVKRLRILKNGLALPAVQAVFSGSGQPSNDNGLTVRDRQGLIAAVDDAIKAAKQEKAAAQAAGDGGGGAAATQQPAGSEQDNDGLPAQQPEQQQELSRSAGRRTHGTGAAAAQQRQPVARWPAAQQQQQQQQPAPAASVAASSPAPVAVAGHKRNRNLEQQHVRVNRARAEQAADDAGMADASPAAGAAAGSPAAPSARWEMLKKLSGIQAGLLRVVPALLPDKAERRQRVAQVEAAMRALRWLKDLDEQDDLLSRFGYVLTWHSLPAVYTATEVLAKFDRAVGKVAEAVGAARWQELLADA